ncbi:MAG: TetR/AcrR family transcriptional regulator [Dehalococcoidia bacterium]|nr:TetR/AcrR family transcriptional regulator [Dehalococcoidia bacterium]
MPRRPKKRRSTEVRRRQIADAARTIAVKYGSEHITVRRIAKEIGVSEGALYRHFKSKRDILSLMVERIQEDLVGDIEKASTIGRTPLETLDRSLRNHVSAIQQRKGVSFQVIAEIISLGDKRLSRQASEAVSEYTRRIRDIVAAAISAGEIRRDMDPDKVAILIAATLQGLVSRWALRNYDFDLEKEYLSTWLLLREAIACGE